ESVRVRHQNVKRRSEKRILVFLLLCSLLVICESAVARGRQADSARGRVEGTVFEDSQRNRSGVAGLEATPGGSFPGWSSGTQYELSLANSRFLWIKAATRQR